MDRLRNVSSACITACPAIAVPVMLLLHGHDPIALVRFCAIDRASLRTGRVTFAADGQSLYDSARQAAATASIWQFARAVGPLLYDGGNGTRHTAISVPGKCGVSALDPADPDDRRDVRDYVFRGRLPDEWVPLRGWLHNGGTPGPVPHRSDLQADFYSRYTRRPPFVRDGETFYPLDGAPMPPTVDVIFVAGVQKCHDPDPTAAISALPRRIVKPGTVSVTDLELLRRSLQLLHALHGYAMVTTRDDFFVRSDDTTRWVVYMVGVATRTMSPLQTGK